MLREVERGRGEVGRKEKITGVWVFCRIVEVQCAEDMVTTARGGGRERERIGTRLMEVLIYMLLRAK